MAHLVTHWLGKQHQNAESQPRIPARDSRNPEVAISLVTLHTTAQAIDPDTAVIYDRQSKGSRKPKAQEMQSQNREAQSLWAA